jgi:plasmid maintenance system killer protein
MVIRFNNEYLEHLAVNDKIKGKPRYDHEVILKYRKTIKILSVMPNRIGLRNLRSLNFEALKGEHKGLYSVRVDYRYRLIFGIEKDLITINEIIVIEDLNNHYQ